MSKSFNPIKDIPDQSGRVIFVTGGTTGLGAGFISFIAAKNPSHIFFSGRNASKASELISKVKLTAPGVKLTFLEADLSSLSSVQSSANKFLEQSTRLDILMLNAGIMGVQPALSKDGYELQFATNHLGHALLIKLLLPTLLGTASQPGLDVRIVNLTSLAYKATPSAGIVFDTLKTDQAKLGGLFEPAKWMRYGQSKLANLLYARELAKRYPSITSVSVHPGFVMTDLHSATPGFADRALMNVLTVINRTSWTPVEEGAYNQTWAATVPKGELVNGAYYEPIGVQGKLATAQSRDEELARKLWEWTQEELKSFN